MVFNFLGRVLILTNPSEHKSFVAITFYKCLVLANTGGPAALLVSYWLEAFLKDFSSSFNQ